MLQRLEADVGGVDKLFDTNGKLTNDSTRKFPQSFMQSFAAWIGATAKT